MALRIQKIASQQIASTSAADTVLSIGDITRALQTTLEDGYGNIAVQGEISNFVQHSSGHRYFTLKDSKAQLKAVMWRSSTLRFTPTNGMNVIARGKVTLYPPNGAVQIECRSLEVVGQGDLQIAFEALKKALYERGWFDQAYKKPLPRFPVKIGVATSPTGAAVRDIIATLARRMPSCEVLLRPTLVQGEGALADIVRAIHALNETDCDVLIIGRGGGSIEDLWAFNTEEVAEAVFRSEIPIISAVGHEIDFTIADFVADVRAATPTAAAELAVRDADEVLAALAGTKEYITRRVTQRLDDLRTDIERYRIHPAFRRIPEHIRRNEQHVDELTTRMNAAVQRIFAAKRQRVESLAAHCASLHPLSPLKRGFALLKGKEGIIGASERLQSGETVELVRQNETATAVVWSVEKRV